MATTQKLTDRRQRFVEEYLIDLNATAAYKRAGYKAQGHSAESAAQRLLRNVEVQEAIRSAQAQRAHQTGLSAARVLEEYRHLAFNDLRAIFETLPTGGMRVRPVRHWPESIGRALASIKVKQSLEKKADGTFAPMEILEFKLHSKTEALKNLGQHLGLFEPKKPGKVDEPSKTLTFEEKRARVLAALRRIAGEDGSTGTESVRSNGDGRNGPCVARNGPGATP